MTPQKSPQLKLSLYFSTDLKEDKTAIRDSEPPWTTSRCHRLLRPLSSKIALLRKMKTTGSKELCDHIIDTSLGHHMPSSWDRCTSSQASQDSEACSTETLGIIDSSDWMNDTRPRKRLRRTYSSKSNVQPPTSDHIPVPRRKRETSAGDMLRMVDKTLLLGFTQLRDDYGGLALQGLRDDEPNKFPNAPTDTIEWEVGCGQKTPLRGAFTKLARNLSPVNWRTLDGLYDGVLALLKATANEKPKEFRSKATLPKITMERRPRSLFATCLRKLPDCIIEEQLSTTTEDPENDVDVSAIMYNYLEQMNTSDAGGWRPLKEVVRAHGIAILVAAIRESLINLPMARALMLLCLEQGAYDEAVSIVEAMITTMKPLSKPETSRSLLYAFRTSVTLQTVQTMGMLTKYSNFEFDHLAKLFDANIIPFDWMYTPDMVDCWNRAVISTTQGRLDAKEAALLLRTVVSRAHRMDNPSLLENIHELRLHSGKKPRKVHKLGKTACHKPIQVTLEAISDGEEADVLSGEMVSVFSNLLTILCVTSLLESSRTSVLTDIGQEARRSEELHFCVSSQCHSCDINHAHLSLSLLASTIATQPLDHHCLDALIRGLTKTRPDFHVTAGTFLCNVAQCYGRMVLKDPFEKLQVLINRLGHSVANRTYDQSRRAAFNAIYINAAFKLAEQSGQPKHFEGALALEQRLGGGKAEHAFRTPGKTPAHHREQARSGFRWEEGICEWVARSPEVAQKLQEACSDEAVVVDKTSKEENIALSIHPYLQDSAHLAGNSPCARQVAKSESHGCLTDSHSKCSNPEPGSARNQCKRGRGRPKKTMAQKRKVRNDNSDISAKDGPQRLGLSQELRNCVRQGCCAAPRIRRVGPVVVIQKAKVDILFRARGTVHAVSQGTGKGFMGDTESEDELSLL